MTPNGEVVYIIKHFGNQEKKKKKMSYTRIFSVVEQSCVSMIPRRGGIGNRSSSTQLGAAGEHLHSRNPTAGTLCTPTCSCTSDNSWGKCRCWKYHLIRSVSDFLQHFSCNLTIAWFTQVEQRTKTAQPKTFCSITKIESQLARQNLSRHCQ